MLTVLLCVFYFLVTGIASLAIMGDRRDTPLMLAVLFASGCVVVPATLIVRVLR